MTEAEQGEFILSKSLTRETLLIRAVNGGATTMEEIVATYADPRNWQQMHVGNPPYCVWVWRGPWLPGYSAPLIAVETKEAS